MTIQPLTAATTTSTTAKNPAFKQNIVLSSEIVEAISARMGEKKATSFVKRVTEAVSQIPGSEVFTPKKSSVVGDIVTLKGEYLSSEDVNLLTVMLNRKKDSKVLKASFEQQVEQGLYV